MLYLTGQNSERTVPIMNHNFLRGKLNRIGFEPDLLIGERLCTEPTGFCSRRVRCTWHWSTYIPIQKVPKGVLKVKTKLDRVHSQCNYQFARPQCWETKLGHELPIKNASTGYSVCPKIFENMY